MECGLLNPGPPALPPVRPSGKLPVRASAHPPSPPNRGFSSPDRPVRPSVRVGPHPRLLGPVRASSARSPVRSTVRTLSAPIHSTIRGLSAPTACPLIRSSARSPTASSAAICPSACPLRARIVRHVCPPHPLRPRETAAAIYTPLRLPSDHPTPCSPRWAPSLCCTFKDCGTARAQGLREVGVNYGGNPCNFFFAQQAAWRGRPFTSKETELQ